MATDGTDLAPVVLASIAGLSLLALAILWLWELWRNRDH